MLGCLLHTPRGPFYSPKAARSRWRPTRKAKVALCRVVHRTVRCTIGQPLFMSGARSPSYSGADDCCRFVAVGAPDTVRCTPDSPVNYSRTPPNSPESGLFTGGQPGAPDTVRCARLSWTSAVHSQVTCNHFLLFFSLFLALRQYMLVLKTTY
jgi:hypothetical protein